MRGLGVVGATIMALTVATACTSGSTPSDPSPSTITSTQTVTRSSAPQPPPTGSPIGGSTSAAPADDCPLISRSVAADRSGMRLDKITVLRSGNKVVGCRIYGLQYPADGCDQTCLDNENLPPASQPALEITTRRYGTKTDAHNAFVRLAEGGTGVQQAQVASGNTGLCFQTDFYAADQGGDWACTFSVGTTMVVVKTVIVRSSFSAIEVTKAVAAAF